MNYMEQALWICNFWRSKWAPTCDAAIVLMKISGLIRGELDRQRNAQERLEKLGCHSQKMGDGLGENTYSVFHRGPDPHPDFRLWGLW